MENTKCNGQHTKDDGSYMAHDARGIPLGRVCADCRTRKLSKYRREVLTDNDYHADEPIDEDY